LVRFDAINTHPAPVSWFDTPSIIARALHRVRLWRTPDRVRVPGMSDQWLREFTQAHAKREPPY
jgi:hypothetical protein